MSLCSFAELLHDTAEFYNVNVSVTQTVDVETNKSLVLIKAEPGLGAQCCSSGCEKNFRTSTAPLSGVWRCSWAPSSALREADAAAGYLVSGEFGTKKAAIVLL